jgi:maltose-binding protein MalE
MKLKQFVVLAAVAVALGAGLTACTSDAQNASQNISTEADQFRIQREIVLYNGITDKYIAVVVGKCSVDNSGISNTLAVTCKVGANKYIKDYWRNADNVTWFELQQTPVAVDVYHTEVVFKPANILPYVNVETGKNGATGNNGDSGSEFTQTVPEPTSTPGTVPGKTGSGNN